MVSGTQPPVTEKNKQVVRDFVEDVFNKHDLAAVDKYMAGAEGLKHYVGEYYLGHPDSHTTIEQIVAKGDKVFVLFNTKAKINYTGNYHKICRPIRS